MAIFNHCLLHFATSLWLSIKYQHWQQMHFFRVDSVDVSLASILRLAYDFLMWKALKKGNKENLLAFLWRNLRTQPRKKGKLEESQKKLQMLEIILCAANEMSKITIFNLTTSSSIFVAKSEYIAAATLHSPLCIFCMLNYTRGAHHNYCKKQRTYSIHYSNSSATLRVCIVCRVVRKSESDSRRTFSIPYYTLHL